MAGGLMQLVAYGAQDVYITGDPQITFFKVAYKRHTNFALESIEQTFNGAATSGRKTACIISRNGDLISGMHLQMKLSETVTGGTFSQFIKDIDVEIGGQRVDKHYGKWMDIYSNLTESLGKALWLYKMVSGVSGEYVFLPLQFWFNRNVGNALPLIALQYHEVKINIEFTKDAPFTGSASLFVDYIYLDQEERKRFAQQSHEYLIEQLQHPGAESLTGKNNKIRLNFNHPVKELIWVAEGPNDNDPPTMELKAGKFESVKLQLNGHDRFSERPGKYFTTVQKYQHHSGYSRLDEDDAESPIYVYSFAINPESHQPSGTCNFSRIDNATLNLIANNETEVASVYIYAINYNILRIVSGMGGLAYSN